MTVNLQTPAPDPTALPAYDFANKGTLVGLLQQLSQSLLKTTDDMLPAVVISYDRTANIATVQPGVHMVTTDGTLVGRAPVAAVPVLALGGGGFLINFPLVAGSRGWIKANDRDISLYLQSGNLAAPNSQRLHSFSDGLFIPDAVSGFAVSGDDASNMVIQNLNGSVKVTLAPNGINIVASAGPVTITGNTIALNGVLSINGTQFTAYKATGVQSGAGEGTGLTS